MVHVLNRNLDLSIRVKEINALVKTIEIMMLCEMRLTT